MKTKRRSAGLYTLIALALVLAILVTGFSFPGFLLPIFSQDSGEKVGADKKAMSFVTGNSKAFSIEPIEGIKISAEENALDKDRKFTLTEVSYEDTMDICRTYERIFPNEPAVLYGLWDLDIGLEKDEILPGTYKMEFDLDTLGIEAEQYENVRLFRIDDDGKWHECVSRIEDGVFLVENNRNCLITISLSGIITWKGAALIGVLTTAGLIKAKDLADQKAVDAGAYMRDVDEYDVKINGAVRYRLHIDAPNVKDLVFFTSKEYEEVVQNTYDKEIKKALQEAIKVSSLTENEKTTALSRLGDDITYTGYQKYLRDKVFKEVYSDTKSDKRPYYNLTSYAQTKVDEWVKKAVENTDEFKKYETERKEILDNKEKLEDLQKVFEQVNKVVEYLPKAHNFLKTTAGVKMYHDVLHVHLSEKKNQNYGQLIIPEIGDPYMVIYFDAIADGDDKSYKKLLLTLCHELFHASQREYVSVYRCNLGFDEMSAQMLEWDAYKHFVKEGTIPREYTEREMLENMNGIWTFSIPLDEFYTKYPEGTVGVKNGSEISQSYYPRARFLMYLRGGKMSEHPYEDIFNKYKGLWGKRAVTTILKEAFGKDEKSLTEMFYAFARSDQTLFYNEAKSAGKNSVFSPELYIQSTKRDVKLPNKSYTIRVRRVKVDHKNKSDKQYALVLRENDDFKDVMSDIKFLPMNMQIKKDYAEYKEGLFFKPKDFPKDVSAPVLYMMEIDGGTAKTSDTGSGYSVCMLIPPEVKYEMTGDKLTIQPMKWFDYKKDIVDSVVVSVYFGKQIVLQEQIMYEGWEKPYTVDLGTIMIDGKPLTPDQMSKLKIQVQECVRDTFDKEGETSCLGPARDIETGIDIAGTWDADITFSFGSKTIDPAVDLYEKTVEQYGDIYGLDSISGLSDLGSMYKGMQKDQQSKAQLIIKPKDVFGSRYEAVFKYDTGAPDETYDGIFDASAMKLVLKPCDKNVTDSKGNSYNLGQFGLQADINLKIEAKKDNSGKSVLTFTGEGANDQNNKIVNYSLKLTGTKVSDKYE